MENQDKSKGGNHHAADEHRDADRIIPRRATFWIAQQDAHGKTLPDQQSSDGQCVKRHSPEGEKYNHDDLRKRHHETGELGGALRSKHHRQRVDAGLSVAFECLKIIECHDAVRGQCIESGNGNHLCRGKSDSQYGGPGEPWQTFVTKADDPRPPPA